MKVRYQIGAQALEHHQVRIVATAQGQVFRNELANQRIVVSTDGGRLWLREEGTRGRRIQIGCRRFKTPWREPNLIAVYVMDVQSRKVRDIASVYDVTFGDVGATFEILIAELLPCGAANAK